MAANVNGSCLHLLLSAASDALCAARRMAGAGDTVCLLADGVMVLAEEGAAGFADGVQLVCATTDLEARGLGGLASDLAVATASDREIAGLLRRHRHCLSWK